MRFLHLSDLHIGRRLNGFSLLEDQKHILSQFLSMAERCDAVLLAGDLYDKAQPSSEAIRTMSDFLVALSRLKKPVFAVSGNHDTAEQVAYCRELLGECGVHMAPPFDGKLACHTLRDAHGDVCVWLLPFIRPASVRPFFPDVRTYEDTVRAALSTADFRPDARHVLVAHQYVSGAEICDSETRLIGGVDQVGVDLFDPFQYVALGHLHSPQKLAGGHVCYCGSPLPYSLSEENQRKAALMVNLTDTLTIEELPLSPMRRVRTVRGSLAEISDPALFSEDYVYAAVTDETLQLDPIGALRITYPHLIGMRIQNSRTVETAAIMEETDAEAFSPLEHFVQFYQAQNNGQLPDEKRMAVITRIMEEAEAKQHATDLA